ncbi:hypothetical protein C0Q70_12490 [Pomacea canaliculata]|uniref:Uncharacterized protein n=1 Tax=Pomacea canaliculata TaxID=400727 RepID=A0A2T7P1P4_POMCA|nr:hypothetical protein C0Q70_12490 [Pomacea canaliculata]
MKEEERRKIKIENLFRLAALPGRQGSASDAPGLFCLPFACGRSPGSPFCSKVTLTRNVTLQDHPGPINQGTSSCRKDVPISSLMQSPANQLPSPSKA